MSSEKKRLLFVTQTTTPYNDSLFDALHAEEDLDLMVYVVWPDQKQHPWKTTWKTSYRKRALKQMVGVDWGLIREALRSPAAVISNSWFVPTVLLLCFISRWRPGLEVAFWTDTPVTGGRSASPVRRLMRKVVLKEAFRSCGAVFGTGPAVKEILVGEGMPPEKHVDMPLFIDLDQYEVANPWDGKRRAVFLAAGRLDDSLKGYSHVIRAFTTACRASGVDALLIIAGAGEDEEMLRRLVRDLEAAEQVQFCGWLDPADMKQTLSESVFFVHGATFEPYGVVVLEAMACGLAVLASTGTLAAVDRIKHGHNGLLHESGEIPHLTRQIQELLEHPEKVRQLQAAARETALQWPLCRGVEILRKGLRSLRRDTKK